MLTVLLICFLAENLALGKPTAQSSTYASGASGNAVDGNPNAGYCSQTQQNNPSWWRVDLGSSGLVPVSEIYIVNKFDGSSSVTNSDYKITFGKYVFSGDLQAWYYTVELLVISRPFLKPEK